MTICAFCRLFSTRGFGFQFRLQPFRPFYGFCSVECQGWAPHFVDEEGLMATTKLSDMELQAVKDARQSFAAMLTELGLMQPFFDRSAEDIDKLITACITGFRASMWRQSEVEGKIPF